MNLIKTHAEGVEVGQQKEKRAIARSMLAKRFDIAVVSEITGLSREEIVAIKRE
jgi:predicted transposase/invertase (TIGR01784 family)